MATKGGLKIVGLVLLSCIAGLGTANARQVSVKAGALSLRVGSSRARGMVRTLRAMQRAGVRGYLNVFDVGQSAVDSAVTWRHGPRSAMVVGVTHPENMAAWQREIGDQSVGLMNIGTPLKSKKTGFIRIRGHWFHWSQSRSDSSRPVYQMTERIRTRDSENKLRRFTETTFRASEADLDALEAFYMARYHGLIKNSEGAMILPPFPSHGMVSSGDLPRVSPPTDLMGTSRWGKENCSAAATSFSHKGWQTAFAENLQGIRSFGRDPANRGKDGVELLARVDSAMVRRLKSVATRLGIEQEYFSRYLTFDNYGNPEATMVTVHNAEVVDARQDLRWRNWRKMKVGPRGNTSWKPNPVIPDRSPSERASGTFASVENTRLSRVDALSALSEALR
jgi:hypothetical protein